MSTTSHPPRTSFKSSSSSHPPSAPTASFLQQRDALVGEITAAMEHVLQSINKLNRSIEGVIAVGNEFGAVEALWSQFENVMAKEGPEPEVKEADEEEERRKGDQQTEEDEGGEVDDGRDEDEVG